MGERIRKVRSDKKKEIKPTIPISLKDNIYRLATLSERQVNGAIVSKLTVSQVGELICKEGLYDNRVIGQLSLNFKSDLFVNNSFFYGRSSPSVQRRTSLEIHERITIRFQQHTYENLRKLAYALDVTPTRAVALLLEGSIKSPNFIHYFMANYYPNRKLNTPRMEMLKQVVQYIQKDNPYLKQPTWYDLFRGLLIDMSDLVLKR